MKSFDCRGCAVESVAQQLAILLLRCSVKNNTPHTSIYWHKKHLLGVKRKPRALASLSEYLSIMEWSFNSYGRARADELAKKVFRIL